MSYNISDNFKIGAAIPLDDRTIVTNLSDLNSITNKYDRLECYVKNETTNPDNISTFKKPSI